MQGKARTYNLISLRNEQKNDLPNDNDNNENNKNDNNNNNIKTNSNNLTEEDLSIEAYGF